VRFFTTGLAPQFIEMTCSTEVNASRSVDVVLKSFEYIA